MKKCLRNTLAAVAVALATGAVNADVNIGVTLALTGPGSGLGIPMQNYFKLWPKEIAGEKINLIILDDATDPGKGVSNARRFITEDKVDMIIGSCITATSAAIAPVAMEARTVGCSACPRAST
jgi:branched-chain amino acid transport system substrate-binding protein